VQQEEGAAATFDTERPPSQQEKMQNMSAIPKAGKPRIYSANLIDEQARHMQTSRKPLP